MCRTCRSVREEDVRRGGCALPRLTVLIGTEPQSAGAGGEGGSGVAPVEAALGAERRQGEELLIGQEGEEGAAAEQADALPIAKQWDPRQQRSEGGQREALAAALPPAGWRWLRRRHGPRRPTA